MASPSGQDLLKFMTAQVVTYMELSKEERKKQRILPGSRQEPWRERWFGMIPLAIKMWTGKYQGKRGED